MPKLNDNQKSLVILGCGVVIALVAGYLAYSDMGELEIVKQNREAKEKELAANKTEIARTEAVTRDVVAYKAIVAQNSKILPTDDDIHNFGRFLGKLERDFNLTFKSLPSFRIPETSRGNPIVPIPMQISFSGTTRGFLRFLNAMESHDRLVNVTSFSITPGSSKEPGADAINDYNLQFTVYRYDAKGGAKEVPIRAEDEATILSMREVKDLIAEKGKPKVLEHYQLMGGRDTRRDMFADPRRSVSPLDGMSGVANNQKEELMRMNALEVLLERARFELDSFIEAKQKNDYLKQHSTRVSFNKAREELEVLLAEVTRKVPPFTDKSLMERFGANVDIPYKKLAEDARTAGIGSSDGGKPQSITAATAQGLLDEMNSLIKDREWTAAAEKANSVDQYVKDTGPVDNAAKPMIAEIQRLGVRAHHQALFEKKQIVVQGVVRMEHASAIIVNGRTLMPGKRLDPETEFLRVEDGDRLIFSLKGYEVEFIQPKPKLLSADRAILED